MPERIQRKRVKGWHMPEGAIYVGRPTRWGNPFRLNTRQGLARVPAVHHPDKPWEFEGRISADGARHDYFHEGGQVTFCHVRYMTAEETVECYRALITGGGWPIDWAPSPKFTLGDIKAELAGHDLACWCPLDQACHADVLLKLANRDRA